MTAEPTSAPTTRRITRIDIMAIAASLRPRQWTKNAIVFAALVFDHRLFHGYELGLVAGAFVAFCLASSAVYVVNDLRDMDSDQHHPTKRFRPIASGRVSEQQGWVLAVALALAAVALTFILRSAFTLVICAYLFLMVAYSFHLKHQVILDVFAISAGFVLRAAGGAVVLSVPISPWLYVCTVLLSLFIAFGKRRHELLLLEGAASGHRRNLEDYSAHLLDQFILVTASATVMAYSLYTFFATNLPENHLMMVTIPIVLYAIFRYLFLIHRRDGGGSPEQLLLSDLPLLGSIVLWGITSVAILYAS